MAKLPDKNNVNYISYFKMDPNKNVWQHYPKPQPCNPECSVNSIMKTLSSSWPRRVELKGPASLKHLYTGIPNYYPVQKRFVPVDTMYGHDFTRYNPAGVRQFLHFKAYPLTHKYVREVQNYADYFLPFPSIQNWQERPVTTPTSNNFDSGFNSRHKRDYQALGKTPS